MSRFSFYFSIFSVYKAWLMINLFVMSANISTSVFKFYIKQDTKVTFHCNVNKTRAFSLHRLYIQVKASFFIKFSIWKFIMTKMLQFLMFSLLNLLWIRYFLVRNLVKQKYKASLVYIKKTYITTGLKILAEHLKYITKA